MRPDTCDMRANMEEQEVEPSEVFVDLGMLIVEGRVPGLTERGYGEGPHCPPAQPGPLSKHECDVQIPQCQRQENFYKHMLLLYKNNIPMSVEVLLCPDCCYGKDERRNRASGSGSAVPEPSLVLLEQWTLHMIPKRSLPIQLSAKGILQAVRSFLHFSQLSAWYSLSKGKAPKNVLYRICVPGETFSNKFNQVPAEHVFPLACAGKQNCVKISVKFLPRCNNIPEVFCHEHSKSQLPIGSCQLTPTDNNLIENFNNLALSSRKSDKLSRTKKPRETIAQRMFSNHLNSNKSDDAEKPSDPMLGDSLLDPPQSLQMYHKRYQSPSRSGSPSLEAPEHLLSCGQKLPSKYDKNPALNDSYVCSECGHNSRPRLKKQLFLPDGSPSFESRKKPNSSASCNSCSCSSFICSSSSVYYDSYANIKNVQSNRQQSSNNDYEPNVIIKSSEQSEKLPKSMLCDRFSSGNNNIVDKWTKLKERKLRLKKENNLTLSEIPLKKPISKLVTSEKPFYTEFSCVDKFCVKNRTKAEESVKYVYHPYKSDPEKRTVSVQTDFEHPVSSHIGLPQSKTWSNGLCHLPSNVQNVDNSRYYDISNDSDIDYDHATVQKYDVQQPDDLYQNRSNVPSESQKAVFRRSLDSATSMVFHNRTSLPLTSSPAPIRKGQCFDYDSSLTSVRAIKRALFDRENGEESQRTKTRIFSTSAPASTCTNSLLGNFEESVLNGRLEPVSTVEGFTAEIGASGSFCPNHITVPVTAFFYNLLDNDKVTSPYLGHVNLGKKGYHVPKKGTIQVTLFNPHQTVVKMFVVMYDFSDMPTNSQTFLRQRILYMPSSADESDEDSQSWLRYLLHLRFCRSKSGKTYLHTDMRMVIFRKSDMDAATIHENNNAISYELRSFTHGPMNPKYSPMK